MKKILFGLALLAILGTFVACDDSGDHLGAPGEQGRLSFSSQTVHTQQYVQGTWTSNIEYPLVTVISSGAELEQYYNAYRDILDFSRHPYSPNGFADAIGKYTNAFFANSFLVLVLLEETSGSNRHRVEWVEENGKIVITRLIPEIGDMAMAQWHIIIELDNNDKLEQFQAVFVDGRLQ